MLVKILFRRRRAQRRPHHPHVALRRVGMVGLRVVHSCDYGVPGGVGVVGRRHNRSGRAGRALGRERIVRQGWPRQCLSCRSCAIGALGRGRVFDLHGLGVRRRNLRLDPNARAVLPPWPQHGVHRRRVRHARRSGGREDLRLARRQARVRPVAERVIGSVSLGQLQRHLVERVRAILRIVDTHQERVVVGRPRGRRLHQPLHHSLVVHDSGGAGRHVGGEGSRSGVLEQG
mmetsp:Transcript_115108/g.332540  ORF Transcript_115108/g.332540 Transcript_115108/m.332540 type:complete len:231 (+) Transcript_115108:95-787(+)